jgi:hypothetical protein
MACGIWVYVGGVECSRVLFVGNPGFLICRHVGLLVLSVLCRCDGGVKGCP